MRSPKLENLKLDFDKVMDGLQLALTAFEREQEAERHEKLGAAYVTLERSNNKFPKKMIQ